MLIHIPISSHSSTLVCLSVHWITIERLHFLARLLSQSQFSCFSCGENKYCGILVDIGYAIHGDLNIPWWCNVSITAGMPTLHVEDTLLQDSLTSLFVPVWKRELMALDIVPLYGMYFSFVGANFRIVPAVISFYLTCTKHLQAAIIILQRSRLNHHLVSARKWFDLITRGSKRQRTGSITLSLLI